MCATAETPEGETDVQPMREPADLAVKGGSVVMDTDGGCSAPAASADADPDAATCCARFNEAYYARTMLAVFIVEGALPAARGEIRQGWLRSWSFSAAASRVSISSRHGSSCSRSSKTP